MARMGGCDCSGREAWEGGAWSGGTETGTPGRSPYDSCERRSHCDRWLVGHEDLEVNDSWTSQRAGLFQDFWSTCSYDVHDFRVGGSLVDCRI